MRQIEVQYQANYLQTLEVPDNCTEEDIIRIAKQEVCNIDFQDGSAIWAPVFYQSPDNPEEWNIID